MSVEAGSGLSRGRENRKLVRCHLFGVTVLSDVLLVWVGSCSAAWSRLSPLTFFFWGGGGRGASFGRSSAIGVESTKQVPVPVLRPGLRLVQVGVRPTEFCDPAPVSHRYFETLLHFISALGWVEWTRGGVPEHFHRHRDFRSAVFREFQIWDSRRRGEVSLESGALDPHAFRTATVSLFRGGFS